MERPPEKQCTELLEEYHEYSSTTSEYSLSMVNIHSSILNTGRKVLVHPPSQAIMIKVFPQGWMTA